ncbi:response regulator [Roseomonas frigidaquae]|uniref:Response regulator n=1 Tax=Falsiroseomonas frigidaquae TaxID=487318 RepID=A0ABX1F099_9PROT|nr:response regulator [Falsiroseomonas frigidaquae]NKE45777.1 response regulator [Falsiroseomonas frigidaquae]
MNMQIGLGSAHTRPATGLRLDQRRQSFIEPASRFGVLVVDDEIEVLEELAATLGRRGLNVLAAGSAEAALAVLRGRRDIATLVSDIRMPVMDGLALAEAALRGRPESEALEVVLITGYASPAHGIAAAGLGAFGVLQKPMRGADLARMVQDALARAVRRRNAPSGGRSGAPSGEIRTPAAAAQPAWPPTRATGIMHTPVAWTRRPTARGGLPQIAPRHPDAAPAARTPAAIPHPATQADWMPPEDQAWPAELPLNPTIAAEALLQTLSQRLDAAGNGIEAIARDLRGPLGDLLRAAPQMAEAAGEPRRLLALLDDLMDIAALEAGLAAPQRAPISAHGLVGAVAVRLSALGLRCGRRIILQPDADPAFDLDTARLVRAMALLAWLAVGSRASAEAAEASPTGTAELSIDAGAGQARLDLVIRPAVPGLRSSGPNAPSPGTADSGLPPAQPSQAEHRLPIAIARRLVALQGGRLDAWMLPEGGLRARMLIRSS